MKKIIKAIVSLSVLFSCMMSIKGEELDENSHLPEINDTLIEDIKYVENNEIHEKVSFYENDNLINTEKITYSDGKYIIKTNDGNIEKIIASGETDYDELYRILFSRSMVPFGSDITNPNFKHVYLGSPGTATYYRSEFAKLGDVVYYAGKILGKLNMPYAAAVELAGQIIKAGSNYLPYKFTVTTTSYQIHFVYDNTYFTHCYHQTLRDYNESGKLINSYTDYYQSVGG